MKRVSSTLAIGGVLILISWETSPSARPTPPSPALSAADLERAEQATQSIVPLTAQIDDQAAQLRARLSQPIPKPQPARNPFVFGRGTYPFSTGNPQPGDRSRAKDLSPVGGNPVEKGYVPLALPVLVAITADATDGGLMRTAVLSMNDEMKTVRPGQTFDRFIVEAIGPESCRIVDITSPTRATFTVAIR
ncbi:MAG: hypothetical protein EPO35_07905 [Acidobacteria bacterium]|nr:MAG: hypothetical protein EPO35_07905 [Acidobacteriota bacterium]